MTKLQTRSGILIDLEDPKPEDIRLRDIAHALAHICRFNGHCREFYSVGQHSVLMSESVPAAYAADALMHDAAEAYVGDVTRPLSECTGMEHHAIHERIIRTAIGTRFGVGIAPMPMSVTLADLRMLATEARDLMGVRDDAWGLGVEPFAFEIQPMSPAQARAAFLRRAKELGITDPADRTPATETTDSAEHAAP